MNGDKYCDKRLLAFLFLVMVAVVVFLHLMTPEQGTVQWARETANLIIGGLVGLVTGYAVGKLSNGNPPKDGE